MATITAISSATIGSPMKVATVRTWLPELSVTWARVRSSISTTGSSTVNSVTPKPGRFSLTGRVSCSTRSSGGCGSA